MVETSMMVGTLTTLVAEEEATLTTKTIWGDLVTKETRTRASTISNNSSKAALAIRWEGAAVEILATKATPLAMLAQGSALAPVVETSTRSLTTDKVPTMVDRVMEDR